MNRPRRTVRLRIAVRLVSMFGILTIAALLLSHAEEAPPAPTALSEARVFTLLDYFDSGRRAVDDFVHAEKDGAALAESIRRASRTCVRLDIRFNHDGGSFQSVTGSGVLLDGGRRVLTAAHSFEGLEHAEIRVVLRDGVVRRARLLAREYARGDSPRDWALLELNGPAPASEALAQARSPQPGDLVIVQGYPDKIGIDARGQVAYASIDAGGYREPLTTLAVVESTQPLTLAPHAGSIPLAGMSGGPVHDASGGLVGIFVSVNRIESESGVRFTYNAFPARGALATARRQGVEDTPRHYVATSW